MSGPYGLAPPVEPLLLGVLARAFPGVVFDTANRRFDLGEPYRFVRVNAEPQGMATPVGQYVRLRLAAWAVRADGTGDTSAALALAADVERAICAHAASHTPFVDAEHDSGPIVMDDSEPFCAYSVVLLTVRIEATKHTTSFYLEETL